MAQFVNIYKCDLHKGPVVTSLHQVFLGDVEANRVGVHVTDNGEDVTLSGTCSGTAILCNGGTVALTGTVDGSLAYVDLPSAVYTVEGPVEIYVTLTQGDQTTTLLTAHGNAVRTDSGVVIDPGTIIPSVAALISDIDDAVASIPADYSDLLGTIAPDFSSSTAYTAGQYVWYSGTLYRFTSDHAAGSWTGTDAIAAEIGEDVADLKGAVTELKERTEIPKLLDGWDSVDYEAGFITESGNVTQSSTWRSSVFIPVEAGNTLTYKLKGYNNVVYIITAYDAQKARIANDSVNGGTGATEGTYTVSSGTAYIRLCSDNNNFSAQFSSENIHGTETIPINEYLAEELPKKLDVQQDISDAGKLLGIGADGKIEAKTVQTEIADNSITYEKLQKAVVQIQQSIVDFWYYNNTKRTDGKSIEVVLPLNTVAEFEYPEGTNTYRVYYASDDGTVLAYTDIATSYFRISHDTENRKYTFAAIKDGKFYIPVSFGTTQYFPANTTINAVETPYPINFLKSGWQPDIMDITVKYPREVYPLKSYNHNGSLQAFSYKIKTYYTPFVGWYKTKAYFNLLDSDWGFIRTEVGSYFYNDGSISYVQGRNDTSDVSPEYVGEGISAFNEMQVISKGDSLNINKPIGCAVVCFGDSITSTGYPSKLQEIAKCIALNYGGSGNSSSKIRKVVTGIGDETNTPFDWTANPVDTAIILAGYNDTYQGTIEGDIPATNIADASNDWTAYLALFNASHPEQGTTCGNIGFMIEWIQANHPDVRIVLCNYHNNTDAKPTRYSDVDTAVQALCEYYGIKYIDIRRTCGINKKNASTYLTDGLHPNDAGQELIAKAIFRAM